MRKRKRRINKIIFFILLILIALNIKNIGKLLYPLKYSNYIFLYSAKNGLDPYLVSAIIKTESDFREKVKSNKDAYGLMQITGPTGEWAAKQMKIDNFNTNMLWEPETNIKIGCWYIDNLNKEFNGDITLVLAAYNGGRGNVQKWLNNEEHSKDGKNLNYIPFKETDMYVKRVKVNYNIYKFLYRN